MWHMLEPEGTPDRMKVHQVAMGRAARPRQQAGSGRYSRQSQTKHRIKGGSKRVLALIQGPAIRCLQSETDDGLLWTAERQPQDEVFLRIEPSEQGFQIVRDAVNHSVCV